jgi:hypothetical protein
MNPGKVTTFARSASALGAGAKYLSDWIQVGTETLMKQIPGGGYSMLRGFVNSDVSGTLDVFQAYNLADIQAITDAVPAAGAGNAALLLTSFTFTSTGATCKGTPYTVAIVAPYVRVRYTNGGGAQATFRLNFDVAE